MSYNSEFEDIMDNINNIAYGYGFKNGIDWAKRALKRGEISWSQFEKYKKAHNLRVRISHGSARNIIVPYEIYQVAKDFQHDLLHSIVEMNRRRNRCRLPPVIFH